MFVETGEYRKDPCSPKLWPPSSWACLADSSIANLQLAHTPQGFRRYIDCDGFSTGCVSLDPSQEHGEVPSNRLWNIAVARTNTYMDFLFIALYWSVFVLLAREYGGKLTFWINMAVTVAALFDLRENLAILKSLREITPQTDPSSIPLHFSQVKWAAFALALLLLGLSVGKIKQFWSRIFAGCSVVAALLTVFALVSSTIWLLSPALGALSLALVIALFQHFPLRPISWDRFLTWIELTYLMRFQLVALIVLALVLPAGFFLAPSFFLGLFDAFSFFSFAFIAWAAFQFAFTIMFTSRLVMVYGPDRFPDLPRRSDKHDLSWPVTGMYASLALPCLVLLCCGSTGLASLPKIAGILTGLLGSIAVLWVTAKLHRSTSDPNNTAAALYPFSFVKISQDNIGLPLSKPAQLWMRKAVPSRLLPGILGNLGAESEERLRSGHVLAVITVGVLIVIYVLSGWLYHPNGPLSAHSPAAMFYLLFLLIFLTWLLSGLAFFLDVIRVPVLTTLLIASFVAGVVRTDHQFTVSKSTGRPPTPQEVLRAWAKKRGEGDPCAPMVVVATAGGGIRAAAWTTQVLTGLSHDYTGNNDFFAFDSSLVLVSSVSGGSLGNMYVVGSYDSKGKLVNLQAIRDASSQTSLSAVGWGLLYPDTLRTIPVLGWGVSSTFDRGSVLEQAWLSNWKDRPSLQSLTLSHWISDVNYGTRPAAIFNSTAAESGQRFLIGSTTVPAMNAQERETTRGTIQFGQGFPNYDMRVQDAARASATFPWVTPMARPRPDSADLSTAKFQMHLADGGYYDNSGVMSATQWLVAARDEIKHHPVMILLIDSASGGPRNGQSWSWQRQILAPITALLSVRTSSQQARAEYELNLTQSYLCRDCLTVDVAHILYPEDSLTPLSWHLTKEQKDAIEQAWSHGDQHLQAERDKIADFLRRDGPMYKTCQAQTRAKAAGAQLADFSAATM